MASVVRVRAGAIAGERTRGPTVFGSAPRATSSRMIAPRPCVAAVQMGTADAPPPRLYCVACQRLACAAPLRCQRRTLHVSRAGQDLMGNGREGKG